jgi:hypothetical protein
MSNIVLNSGSGGSTLGTDTVTGVDYQIVKVGFSVAGSAPVHTSATNPLPSAAYFSGTAASANSGTKDAGTLRVVLATDQPALSNAQPVLQSGSWTVTVNGVVADATAFTRGTTVQLPVGGVIEAVQSALTTGQTRALSLTTAALLRVDGSNVTQPVSGTFWQATQPVSGTVTSNQGGSNWSVNLVQANGTTLDTNSGNKSAGTVRVVIATDQPALTNAQPVSQSGAWTVQPGNTANTTPWLVSDIPSTAPGSSYSRIKAAASTNSTNLKASAGVVLGYCFYNNTASAKYFKFYDKASAPTVGTDTPAFTVIIPASGGANIEFATGIPFANGIGYGITGAVTDADTTNTAADDVHGVVLWK